MLDLSKFKVLLFSSHKLHLTGDTCFVGWGHMCVDVDPHKRICYKGQKVKGSVPPFVYYIFSVFEAGAFSSIQSFNSILQKLLYYSRVFLIFI